MTVRILIGDVRDQLRTLADDSVDCVVTSPPYWGLRDYDVEGQIGMERTLGEHLGVMVEVFREVRRVVKPNAAVWINYGDCYATSPNGRSAADTKAAGNDDRTFRDKPFSTVGAIYDSSRPNCKQTKHAGGVETGGRIRAGGTLKPKDLCMIPNRLAIALQDDGWWVRSEIIWGKPNPMPDSSGRYRPSTAHEKIFLLSKSGNLAYDAEAVALPVSGATHARVSQDIVNQVGSARANAGGKTNGNMKAVIRSPKMAAAGSRNRNNQSFNDSLIVPPETRYLRNFEPAPLATWTMPTASFSQAHFATFPPELVERCLRASLKSGGVILDPFGGAGTTGMVAEDMGHDSILIELNPKYAAIADNRIRAAIGRVAGKPLSQSEMPEMLRLMESAE